MAVEPCPSTPAAPVRGIVTFSATAFKVAFPEFATVADAALVLNFGFAQLALNNSCRSVVFDANQRDTLLQLLVAHITQLRNGVNGAAAGGLVGRISEAAEGSDSVSADMGQVTFNAAWFLQTTYGAMFWQFTAQYRTFRYIPPPAVCADLPGGGAFPVMGPGGPCGC